METKKRKLHYGYAIVIGAFIQYFLCTMHGNTEQLHEAVYRPRQHRIWNRSRYIYALDY